jgi:crotonobetainyl-CoA:carnitine CoA-transferase CaiB-like acyl-CoA transferase
MAADHHGTRPAYEGITVLELGHVYLGPYCSMLMNRLGAEVIKIEPPGGEPLRSYRAPGGDATASFNLVNAGKQGLGLDLKQSAGRELFLELVESADVVVENFGPETLGRLELEYEALAERNPRIILASGRGYGPDGPYRNHLAMDLTVQAMTGVLSVTGFPDSPPVKAGAAVADFIAGTHLMAGVAAALYQRTITGRGQHVTVSMHDALLPTLASPLASFLDTGGTGPERTGNRHGGLAVAPYNVYPARDGWIAILSLNDRHWRSLCKLIGQPELGEDPRFATNRERADRMETVDEIVSEWTAGHPKRELFELLGQASVPAAPVLDLSEVVDDPQVHAQRMLYEVDAGGRRVLTFGTPLRLSASPPLSASHVPGVGSESREILTRRLGLDSERLDELAATGVI